MCKILVVDDKPDFRETLRGILSDEGYTVQVAANEAQALATVTQEPFDFILIDMRLHGHDEEDESGLSLAMAVKFHDPKAHIILLTRYVRTRQIIRATRYLDLSESDFIDKETQDWDERILQTLAEAREEEAKRPRFEKTPDAGKKILETVTDTQKKAERAKPDKPVQQYDSYSPYETGLHQLLNRIGRDHPRYSEMLVYQMRLVENISQSRLYGDTDTHRSNRFEIIGRLNDIALATLGMSFNELCNPTPVEANKEHRQSQYTERRRNHMDWSTIITLAVSTVSPYAAAFAMSAAAETGKETVKIAAEGIKALAQKAWQWLEHTVSKSGSESDKEVWKNFKKKPESYEDALAGIILRLCPNEDVVLRGYTEGVVQAIEQREGAQIYALLEKKFMRGDIEEIASRITSEWKDKVSVNYNKIELANWVIRYSQTRNLLSELIAAMLIVNPSVVLE